MKYRSIVVTHVSGIYKNGAIVLDEPVDWPEGTHVEILQPGSDDNFGQSNRDFLGDGTRYPETPSDVTEILRRMDLLQPFELSESEAAEIEEQHKAWRAEQKTLAHREAKKLDHMFE